MLVDEHTLDSYLAACALSARRVVLLYDRQMAQPFAELAGHLQKRLGAEVAGLPIDDDCTREELDAACAASLDGTPHLHYTGGTGMLSAHARMVFEARWPKAVGSCLDEDRRVLRFDDGRTAQLRDLLHDSEVMLSDIAQLQGLRVVNRSRIRDSDDFGLRDATVAACAELGEPISEREHDRLQAIRRERATSRPAGRFIAGGWLEMFTAAVVRRLQPAYELQVGVRLKRDAPTFELDVVAVGRYHPYILSCTTSHDGRECKHKLFEVKERARRLAGAVGRPALVALADTSSRPSPDRLRRDLADLWETASTPRVFDRASVVQWLRWMRGGAGGSAVEDLTDWLVS